MMGWFTLGKKKGLTPGPGHQNAANDEPLSSHAATYLTNVDPDNVAPVEYPSPDQRSRSTESSVARGVKCDLLASWLLAKAEERMWIEGRPGQGVFVKKHKGTYAHSPDCSNDNSGLHKAIIALNVRCAMTVNTKIIHLILSRTDLPYVQIQAGKRLQIVPDFGALAYCQKNQSAAFVKSHQTLVVWEDDPEKLLDRAQGLQDTIIKMVWGNEITFAIEKGAAGSEYDSNIDSLEGGVEPPRKTGVHQAIYTAAATLLLMVTMGAGWKQIGIQQVQDPNWLRLLFILTLVPHFWLSLFFFQAIIGNLCQIAGSHEPLRRNSKYFSANPPKLLHRDTYGPLPHVTIQMPVYKEGLEGVIKPTVQSVKQAIATYELQGGTANIFINDDGMQLISQDEAAVRQEFYEENGIGWVARPGHNPKPKDGERYFLRRGKFKKASNMNYALRLSLQVEEKLALIDRHERWSQWHENQAYEHALKTVLEEREGEAWADGSILVGDYILLIDSDTRVPQDCLLEAVSEMEQCPDVAILQYISGVMNVTNTFFENGITFFTNMIYTMIKFAVANGDVAPFVGHNAVLRWRALQGIAYECELDCWTKFWSENTVSEDFDMALRLQCEGYTVRLGAYKDDGFKEGVSLTVYDELNRWEKYAYGCSELIFHPLKEWFHKGPLTRMFLVFLGSRMPLHSKITIMSYVGTYYAIGSAWYFTILNYFLIGFFNGALDHYYIDSFRVYVALVFVFTVLGNISLASLRYRSENRGFLSAIAENIKWIPMFTIFLGGLSLHVSQALLAHFLSIDMQWGSTSKEVEDISFLEAMRHVVKKFKWTFLSCIVMVAAMLVCAFGIQEDWQIREVIAYWPLASVLVQHFLLPIVLNPQLMRFTW